MSHSYHLHSKVFCCHLISLDLAKTMYSSIQVEVPFESMAAVNSQAISSLHAVVCVV